MVSMQDIADKVGISKATVSLVLNGKAGSRVSQETQNKVKAAAEEMHYQVNDLARSLRTGRTNLISIVVPDISNDFFGKMSFHIQEKAKGYGFLVISANSNESSDEFSNITDMLISKKVAGVIAVPPSGCDESLRKLINHGIPVVQIDRYISSVESSYIGLENYASTQKALEQLLATGVKRVAMLTYDLNVNAIHERRQAFEETLSQAGLYDPALVKVVPYAEESVLGEKFIKELSGLHPDAIFFTSKRIFMKTMMHLSLNPEMFPEDLMMLAYDDVSSYMSSSYRINYIEQPLVRMSEAAFDALRARIEDSQSPLIMEKMMAENHFQNR